MTLYIADLVSLLRTQIGDPYIWGREVSPSDPNPYGFDCSEYVEWGVRRKGGYIPDGSSAQYEYCRSKGTTCSVTTAINTFGALLHHYPFDGRPGHIAVSLGNGYTLEARGKAYGVGTFAGAASRGFTHGMRVPGFTYGAPLKPPTTAPRWPGRNLTQPPQMKMLASEAPYQKRLATLGLYKGAQDLLYGPGMEAATVALQHRYGLVQDGIAGERSWYAAWR